MLRKPFLRGIFGVVAMHISSFLIRAQGGTLEFVDSTCMLHLHQLRFEILPKDTKIGNTRSLKPFRKMFCDEGDWISIYEVHKYTYI